MIDEMLLLDIPDKPRKPPAPLSKHHRQRWLARKRKGHCLIIAMPMTVISSSNLGQTIMPTVPSLAAVRNTAERPTEWEMPLYVETRWFP